VNTSKYRKLLEKAAVFHGHLCAGQIIGVRMAMLGLQEVGLEDEQDRKKLIVFVETDRCATDAIMTVTGCRVGKRSMKVLDYGKMAATFVNLETGRAVRIRSRADARERSAARYPQLSEMEAQKQSYGEMADSELFEVQDVRVSLAPQDLPGPPLGNVTCAVCGETILDKREIGPTGLCVCRPCGGSRPYYHAVGAFRTPRKKEVVL